jgi:hypothetical protein
LGYNSGFTGIGTVSQTITTVPGQQYEIDFAYLAENGTPNSFVADFGSNTLFSVFNDVSNTTNPATWTHITAFATAPGTSTTLSFTSNNDPFYDALDSVSVEAVPNVPEPASLALLGIGIAAIAGYSWRRRKLAIA